MRLGIQQEKTEGTEVFNFCCSCCSRLSWFFFLVAVLACSSGYAALTPTADFELANKLYEEGKFQEAAAVYERVSTNQPSAAVYYNLGNACFKAGQPGRAIAAYRQAEVLKPRDPNLRFNLEFVRKKVTGFESARRSVWERMLGALTLNEWCVLAVCAYWIWFLLLALREFRPALKRTLRGYTATAGLATIVLAGCLGASDYQQANRTEAVVVVPNAVVRRGPLDESPVFYQAPDGSEILVLDQKEVTEGSNKQLWLQVQDSTRRTGWLQRDQVVICGKGSVKHAVNP